MYFAVAKLGDAPIDGKTDTNPEGLTAATGKHAEAFAARLAGGDLSCKVCTATGEAACGCNHCHCAAEEDLHAEAALHRRIRTAQGG